MFALFHSPLTGPFTWALVAEQLRQRGHEVVTPNLHERYEEGTPYWAQHAAAVARTLSVARAEPVLLVAHSGAGMLLPAIRQLSEQPVAGYIFVDAGLPVDGRSRLDLFENQAAVQQFRQAAVHGLVPPWADDDLRAVLPDDAIRAQFLAELRPLPLAVYEEPLSVFAEWPDAPCGYLQFSAVYDSAAANARDAGFTYRSLAGGHFHMLVEPQAVAEALLSLSAAMDIHPQSIHRSEAR